MRQILKQFFVETRSPAARKAQQQLGGEKAEAQELEAEEPDQRFRQGGRRGR